MRKLSLIFIALFFVQLFCVFADNNASSANSLDKNKPKDTDKAKPKGPLWIKDRSFEIGLVNLHVSFANSFLSLSEIFQDVIILDLDKLANGFNFNLGANITPFYFKFKLNNGMAFGLSTDIDAIGVLNISGNMLNLNEAIKDNSDIGGAVFSSITVESFFHVQKFKVKINPSLFYALAYITPTRNMPSSVVYTLDYSDGTVAYIDYAMRIYTGYSTDNGFSITSNPGVDFTIGAEYPLAKEIGLTNTMPFLDFDVGLDLINFPFFPSTMDSYKQIKGRLGKNKQIKIINKNDDDDDSFFSNKIIDGKEEVKVSRPFKMITWIDWRPLFGSKFLTVTPVIGFCYNALYYKPFSLEVGLNSCLNLRNLFLIKLGFNYTDRMFVNSLGFVLNFKAFELDIGADLRSQNSSQAWSGAGLGVNFGLKFGW